MASTSYLVGQLTGQFGKIEQACRDLVELIPKEPKQIDSKYNSQVVKLKDVLEILEDFRTKQAKEVMHNRLTKMIGLVKGVFRFGELQAAIGLMWGAIFEALKTLRFTPIIAAVIAVWNLIIEYVGLLAKVIVFLFGISDFLVAFDKVVVAGVTKKALPQTSARKSVKKSVYTRKP